MELLSCVNYACWAVSKGFMAVHASPSTCLPHQVECSFFPALYSTIAAYG